MSYLFFLIAIPLLLLIFVYNNLISKKNKVLEAFSSIDVIFKKRTDLIPRLVSTVKGYMKHERETLTEITKIREQIINDNLDSDQRVVLENKMDGMLGKLNIAVEAYPDLKAGENFLQLQASLNEVEEQLSAARRAYNAAVNDFNNAIEMFPSNIIAKLMGYKQKLLFKIDPSETKPPVISF
ncbi:LemA family protein [Flagellimonas hymeniacidonis]|uniref:LemA family protein n=1 Tax=Flagellimonas hymeniacidonis TaxID=2603628 RepID=A0A5C8V075_9FLAO|nr:LemA family protein [Flagellimonas hymeniacidonis]TXN34874.1 LemA family protein [Flagellimonas hymeniacidonis]